MRAKPIVLMLKAIYMVLYRIAISVSKFDDLSKIFQVEREALALIDEAERLVK